jgi:TPR repeat protein
MVAALLRRGEAQMAVGDISGARRLFERAAAGGSAAAAFAAGGTYDPAVLAAVGAHAGVAADPAAAAAWYRRAAELGEPKAADRLLAVLGAGGAPAAALPPRVDPR